MTWTKLIAAEAIAERVRQTGRQLADDYAGRDLILVGLLQGALYFLADLTRAIPMVVEVATLRVKSYAGTESSGTVKLLRDLDAEVAGRDVLLVDDIYDSGRTLSFVREHLLKRRPQSVEIACLLIKDVPRAMPVEVKYGLFPIPNVFVVGAGLDLDGYGRNLHDVWALEPGVAESEARESLLRQFPSLMR